MVLSPIFCSECGAQNVPGARFCVTCGHVLRIPDAPLDAVNSPGTGLLPQGNLLNNRYRIRELVGTGGMGAVYKAEDTPYGDRPVAVKEMRQSSLSPQELEVATEQFKVEAIMLARLQHPGLPRIYDHFLEGSRWYLVMDFIEGETLDERMRRTPGRRLPPPEVVKIGIQLCKVLDYLHKRQPPVVFRDLKPSNVMLTPEGHLYLIDFGIARIFKPGQAKDTKAYGSIGYSAPEQFDREQTTAQADIYSLGITLHEVLSGSIPARSPFNMPRLSFPGQPALERLATLIMQMIELDKEKRPASVEQVRQELESIRSTLKQAFYIPSAPHSTMPPVQNTPQPIQEQQGVAPTQYVPPPVGGTVAVPSFTESALPSAPVAAVAARRSATRRRALTIGNSQIITTIAGIIIFAVVTFILGQFIAAASGSGFLFDAVISSQATNTYFVRWDDILLSLSFCIPCFFGARFGVLVGLVIALIGAALGELISQFFTGWYSFIGFAALGFLPGMAYIKTRGSYKKASNILLAVAYSFVAILLWGIILLVGDFVTLNISFALFFPTLIPILLQLIALIPLVIALLTSNAFTKRRTS